MALTDLLFGRKRALGIDLPALCQHLADALPRYLGRVMEPDLVHACLADLWRDTGLDMPLPEHFRQQCDELDEEGWRRLALAGAALELEEVRELLAALHAESELGTELLLIMPLHASDAVLLTLDLLSQSRLRIEEFARLLLRHLELPILGETEAESVKRLDRLDYARLLEEAEQARQAAEGRMENLRRLQDAQEQRRARRGKW